MGTLSSYTLPHRPFIVSSAPPIASYRRAFRDIETSAWKEGDDFNDRELEAYLENGWQIFNRHLRSLRNPDAHISDEEERTLHFMLSAIIHAKRSLKDTR